MHALEQLLGLSVVALLLSAAARRSGAPYPVFLALGGALLALVPAGPTFALPPELALALFVAPVLVDSAYDMSLRDLRDNWASITGLVVVAVGMTTAAVAIVAHCMVPTLPWAAAIALGAIVAPPDAVAATALLRQLRPPHRIITILEGESLFNDATALLIYRVAVGAVAAQGFTWQSVGPMFLLAGAGSLAAGFFLGRLVLYVMEQVDHIPTSIILQFVFTFGVWILAEHLGLSAVLTMVCFAITLKRSNSMRSYPQVRIATNAVWSTVIFALNILAFIFIGLQTGPILKELPSHELMRYLAVSCSVLLTVIGVRIAWIMSFNAVVRRRNRLDGFHPPRPMLRPTMGSGFVISWAGMRGIVTLTAAMALPDEFPHRSLILLVAFGVVIGTLVIQGLTLKPLLRLLRLDDNDPIGREIDTARIRAYQAGLDQLSADETPEAGYVREKFTSLLEGRMASDPHARTMVLRRARLYRHALHAAREALHHMHGRQDIGDDALRHIEQELDLLEMTIDGETRFV